MKKLIVYIMPLFLFSCNNPQPAPGTNNTPAPKTDKKRQTAQKFIGYLKSNDIKSAINMLDYWDSAAPFNVNAERVVQILSEIDSSTRAIKLCGLDTAWKFYIDTFRRLNHIYACEAIGIKWKAREPLSDRDLLFLFDPQNDTSIKGYIFVPLY